MATVPSLHPHIFYGLKTGIRGNALYLTEHDILYPAGGVLVVHNFTHKTQKYINLPDRKKVVNILLLNPDRTILAVAERGEKPSITLYDVKTLRRKKLLGVPFETDSHDFVAMDFSFDGTYIVAITGEPDWMLLYYNWEKGKVESTAKANIPNNPGPITQISCNPSDNCVVAIVGPGLFRLLSVSESVWRQYGFQRADLLPLTCCCWLTFDRVLAGTKDGRFILVESGELKAMYKATELTILDAKIKDEASLSIQPSPDEDDVEIKELYAFHKGFMYVCGLGTVHMFEKETNHKYRKRNVFVIPKIGYDDKACEDLNVIQNLCISPGENVLLATTLRTQLFSVRLWGLDLTLAPEIYFKIVGEQLHHGPINGLAMCAWKPIFMTSGEFDRTIRIWNYETESQELLRQYQEEICSLALHPTGLYALVGFSDKLRFMMILIDDIQSVREFGIRRCQRVSFSSNGHLFAVANEPLIQIYSTISYANIYNLEGHGGKIVTFKWTHHDEKVVSSIPNAVFEWNLSSGMRSGEVIFKTCDITDIAVTKEGSRYYVIGNDGQIREVHNSEVIRTVDLLTPKLDCLLISHSDLMIFVSGGAGNILSVQVPFTDQTLFQEFLMHDCTITWMGVACDDQTLISCSEDGTLCLWKIAAIQTQIVRMDKEFSYAAEILINKDDLKDKIHKIVDLTQRIKELENEHNYQMRQTEAFHADKLKEVHEGYCQVIEELKDKNEQLESEHTQEMNTINNEISKMKSSHEQAIQSMETSYNAKLIVEYDKYQLLEDKMQKMRDACEKEMADMTLDKEKALKELTESYESQLHEKNVQIEELHEESNQQIKEHERIKLEIEDDADREIVEVKTRYELQLKEEKDINVRLRGEAGVMKKKFISSQKEIDEFKHQVHTLQGEHQKFQATISGLDRDINDLKKEINERDATIQDKEKRIYDLKRKNQELEKFKFVLNYKIKELKNQIEPKDREIKEKKEQIQDMELELENLQKTNTSLDLQLAELKEKLHATDMELQTTLSQNRGSRALFRRMQMDLHDAAGLIQEPNKLKQAVTALYHKYSQDDDDFLNTRVQDVDAQAEFMRQREHLERTVAALKRQAAKETKGAIGDGAKIMEENVTFIVEINNLRRELKLAQRHISDMESILGLSAKYMSPKEAQARLSSAVKKHDDIHNEYKAKLEENEKLIRVLREEVQRLVQKLGQEDQAEQVQEKRKILRHKPL
ncbi:cilia- and flagella-associated protein 57 [Anabrus simplex]|uniref:cilia- and flagella-associated protein 57 n=1 Tax=Anabrus simplex TaxID=316456 RepID=UPI0035A2A8F3